MLVATPGQTTAYSTIHNNSNGGGGGNSTAAATSSSKKSTTLNSTNTTAASGTPKSVNNNNHTASTVANKNCINTNTHGTVSYNYHTNPKNDNSATNKLNNQTKMTATSSRETILSSVTTAAAAAATTHSSKTENSTNNANANNTTTTTTTKQQSFIQTLKDSVQKALISTTGSSSTTIAKKLANNCNNSTTSIQNVTSSSSSTSHNANKVSTTTSSTNSGNSTVATQSSSSMSLVRSKYFSCSLSKLHTVAPTILHRYPEERQQASSTDSLQKEMCHFKPIRIVPTTPWKSGSKSRGNSLRFPKANLATKKTEFVLKSNCDVNNRKKKQQQNRTQTDQINVDDGNDDDDDNNEQENKEFYGIYKPKPSLTCLSTSVTTPNHQSAFVCLVAQMKSLVNLQSKKQHSPVKSAAAADESINELYVRKKPATKKSSQLEVPKKELAKTRTTRLSSNGVKNKRVSNTNTTATIALNHSKENVKRINAKSNNLSKLSTVAITKVKSLRKVGRAKSKTVNLINLATTRAKGKLQTSVSMPAVISNESKTATAATSKRTRKRKNPHDNDETHPPNKTASIKSLVPAARKSSRQSKDLNSATNKLFKSPINQNPPQTTLKSTQKSTRKNPAKAVCFSPPLTRSRLKHLAEQGKIITANTPVVAKKRRN